MKGHTACRGKGCIMSLNKPKITGHVTIRPVTMDVAQSFNQPQPL